MSMRFLCVFRSAQDENVPPSQQEMAAMGQLIEEMTNAGVLLSAEGCAPSAKGARLRKAGSAVTVTDGPFTETKELIGGFAMLRVDSKEEAIKWTKRFLAVVGDGEAELRLMHDEPAAAPAAAAEASAAAR